MWFAECIGTILHTSSKDIQNRALGAQCRPPFILAQQWASTELEAAQKYDDAVRRSGAPRAFKLRSLNFRRADDYFCEATWHDDPTPEGAHSRFIGVHWDRRHGKFQARWQRKSLGYFASELEAAHKFDEHSLKVNGPTNFRPPSNGASR